MNPFRSLYGRFAAAFVLLFIAAAVAAVIGIDRSTRMYEQEATQRLNRDLAGWIVAHYGLDQTAELDPQAIERVFGDAMHVNPTIELYLLDTAGHIQAYNAPTGAVRMSQVDMAPLRAYFARPDHLPVLGDDPRHAGIKRIFSVAPVGTPEAMSGYLYIVIGGADYQSLVDHFRTSHILRVTLGIALAALLAGAVWGSLSFAVLTRRVRRLAHAMEGFQRSGFSVVPGGLLTSARGRFGDEIDRLGSSLRALMELIMRQIAQLRDSDSRMREMVASLSHDLRTPLTSLGCYIDTVLLKDAALGSAERRSLLQLAGSHHARLRRLIDTLFELAQLELPGVTVELQPTSLSDLLCDVAQKFSLRVAEKGLTIDVQLPEDVPQVRADVGLLERALENLIENALRYTASGGTVALVVESAGGARVRVAVRDTGIGIAPQHLERIFDRFYRVDQPRQDRSAGAGLGLSITRRIVELHDSVLEVRSEVGVGTEFSFLLDVLPESAQTLSSHAA